jgi:hypothetical protein
MTINNLIQGVIPSRLLHSKEKYSMFKSLPGLVASSGKKVFPLSQLRIKYAQVLQDGSSTLVTLRKQRGGIMSEGVLKRLVD